jgi:hypothetical protein
MGMMLIREALVLFYFPRTPKITGPTFFSSQASERTKQMTRNFEVLYSLVFPSSSFSIANFQAIFYTSTVYANSCVFVTNSARLISRLIKAKDRKKNCTAAMLFCILRNVTETEVAFIITEQFSSLRHRYCSFQITATRFRHVVTADCRKLQM